MFSGPLLRFLVEFVEIGVELIPVDPPHAPAPQFDGGETSGPNQGVDLRHADAEVIGHVFKREEPWLQGRLGSLLSALGSALWWGHPMKIAPPDDRYLDLVPFAPVWRSS